MYLFGVYDKAFLLLDRILCFSLKAQAVELVADIVISIETRGRLTLFARI